MALIVEDGTIVANSESYISVADADAYFVKYGPSTEWVALTSTQKEVALRLSTQFIDQAYDFHSELLNTTQSLSWPRELFQDTDYRLIGGLGSIPTNLKQATALLALQFSQNSPITATATYDETNTNIKREKIGPNETEYYAGAQISITTSNPIVSRLIANLGRPKGSIRRVVRG